MSNSGAKRLRPLYPYLPDTPRYVSVDRPAIGSPDFVRVNYKFAFSFCWGFDLEVCNYVVGLARLLNAAAF
jgi:hypothetical protein